MKRLYLSVLIAIACTATSMAQGSMAPAKPAGASTAMGSAISQPTMGYYVAVKDWLTRSAAAMPESDYGFRPQAMPAADKAEIRTFGQIVGHLADANYMFCGTASGMTGGTGDVEKTKTKKADLEKALADSFAFCDKAWASTDDKNATTAVAFPAGIGLPPTTRLGALSFNTAHEAEHYGNIVVYLRMKGIVPPSSQPVKK